MNTLRPLRILIVEDEALISMDLEYVLQDLGHEIVGVAASSDTAMRLASEHNPDLAFVDIQLLDGPTGVDVAAALARGHMTKVVFTSGNVSRIPEDFAGAVGSIGKPYSERGVKAAISYLMKGILSPPPDENVPPSLTLAPEFLQRWSSH